MLFIFPGELIKAQRKGSTSTVFSQAEISIALNYGTNSKDREVWV
jgi:hypothetical protein